MLPKVILGVPLMDEDHGKLEELLETVAGAEDEALPALLAELETEIRAHFGREEELMKAHELQILSCHVIQHRLFLAEFAHGYDAVARGDKAALRRFLASTLPHLLAGHVDTVDRVTASLLTSGASADTAVQPPAVSW